MNTAYQPPQETIEQVKDREQKLAQRLAMSTEIMEKLVPSEQQIKDGDVIGRLFAQVIKAIIEGNRELIIESMLHTPNPELVQSIDSVNRLKAEEARRGNH